ncbi:MAG: DUF5655 domain-containing protein, partial [Caulobacteraceae bacterium]
GNMPGWDEDALSPRQRKWFASVREGLERDTGRTLEAWAEIARTCPESKPRARQLWLKEHHGLAQNRAAAVLSVAFPATADATAPLWSSPNALAIFQAVEAAATALPDVVVGPRKAYTAFSRAFQFAAASPLKDGTAVLGLALPVGAGSRLSPPGRQPWSERLKSKLALRTAADVDADVADLLRRAWEAS